MESNGFYGWFLEYAGLRNCYVCYGKNLWRQKINQSKIAFFFYFLGLTNLMFNWGHHTYIVPASPIVKLIAYSISMTELLYFMNIIYSFRKTYLKTNHQNHKLSFKILTYAEIWILLNLVLSISISIPAINFYTHGTHITVAHAMGSTIGINTSQFLLASITLIVDDVAAFLNWKRYNWSLLVFNLSLVIFWVCLVGMGLQKFLKKLQNKSFYDMINSLSIYFKIFTSSALYFFLALIALLYPLFKFSWHSVTKKNTE